MLQGQHPLYKQISNSFADSRSWVFAHGQGPVEFAYRHLPLKPYHVQVEIHYFSISQNDLLAVRGKLGTFSHSPICPGQQASGFITAVGSKSIRKVGERVALGPILQICKNCQFCLQRQEHLCQGLKPLYHPSQPQFGAFSTHIHVHQNLAITLPQSLALQLGACLLSTGLSIFQFLNQLKLKHKRVAVIGFGNTGKLAINMASKMGFQVQTFLREKQQCQYSYKLGSLKNWIIYSKEDLFHCRKKYQLVLNTFFVDNQQTQLDIQYLTADGGKFYNLCADFKTDFYDVVTRNLTLTGRSYSSIESHYSMIDFVENYGLDIQIRTFKFEQFAQAFRIFEQDRPDYRVVIKCK